MNNDFTDAQSDLIFNYIATASDYRMRGESEGETNTEEKSLAVALLSIVLNASKEDILAEYTRRL